MDVDFCVFHSFWGRENLVFTFILAKLLALVPALFQKRVDENVAQPQCDRALWEKSEQIKIKNEILK